MKEYAETKAINRNLVYLLIGISSLSLILIIIFAARIAILSYQIRNLEAKNQTTTTNSTIPNVAIAGQIKTRIISSPDLSFTIDLPESWTPVETSNTRLTYQAESNIYFSIEKIKVNIVTTLKQYLESVDEQNKTGFEGKPSKIVLKSNTVVLGAYEAMQRSENWTAAGFIALATYAKIDDNIYILSLYPTSNQTVVNLYQEALETFRIKPEKN